MAKLPQLLQDLMKCSGAGLATMRPMPGAIHELLCDALAGGGQEVCSCGSTGQKHLKDIRTGIRKLIMEILPTCINNITNDRRYTQMY